MNIKKIAQVNELQKTYKAIEARIESLVAEQVAHQNDLIRVGLNLNFGRNGVTRHQSAWFVDGNQLKAR